MLLEKDIHKFTWISGSLVDYIIVQEYDRNILLDLNLYRGGGAGA